MRKKTLNPEVTFLMYFNDLPKKEERAIKKAAIEEAFRCRLNGELEGNYIADTSTGEQLTVWWSFRKRRGA